MPLSQAVHFTDAAIPFLAPEIVLLFKAKHNRAKDKRDLHHALPLMNSSQLSWLTAAIEIEHPGHVWLQGIPV